MSNIQKKNVLLIITGIMLLTAYALGFTVRADIWNTRNVISTMMPHYAVCGALALGGIFLLYVLSGHLHPLVRLIICMFIGACTMFALTSMWYNCAVEVAYIYGEGNLEIGNEAAVRGSVLAMISSIFFLVSGLCTVALSARK